MLFFSALRSGRAELGRGTKRPVDGIPITCRQPGPVPLSRQLPAMHYPLLFRSGVMAPGETLFDLEKILNFGCLVASTRPLRAPATQPAKIFNAFLSGGRGPYFFLGVRLYRQSPGVGRPILGSSQPRGSPLDLGYAERARSVGFYQLVCRTPVLEPANQVRIWPLTWCSLSRRYRWTVVPTANDMYSGRPSVKTDRGFA